MFFLILKFYAFDVIKINSNDMNKTLEKGDVVLIKRIFNSYERNDLIYHRISSSDTTLTKSYTVQRLIGLPGDSLEIIEKKVYINAQVQPEPEQLQFNYYLKANVKLDSLFLSQNQLTEGGEISNDLDYSYSITKSNCEVLRTNEKEINDIQLKLEQKGAMDETVYPYSSKLSWNRDFFGKIVVPKKDWKVKLDSLESILYFPIIKNFEGKDIQIKNDSVYIDNRFEKEYIFENDYYFLMGDNRDNANDSRIFGFVPKKNLKGKVIKVFSH